MRGGGIPRSPTHLLVVRSEYDVTFDKRTNKLYSYEHDRTHQVQAITYAKTTHITRLSWVGDFDFQKKNFARSLARSHCPTETASQLHKKKVGRIKSKQASSGLPQVDRHEGGGTRR